MWPRKRKEKGTGNLRASATNLLEAAGLEITQPLKHLNGRRANRQTMYACPKGSTWNPLIKYPANKGCFCGSGLKAKKCCIPYLMRCVSFELAEELTKRWDDLMRGTWVLPKAPRGSE